jgi:deazaflavin-dependent oxidoreductase (nitroreductase family)
MAAGSDAVADDPLGTQLAGWGKVALLETRGRASGRVVRTAVGFVDDGRDLLVAAGTESTDWALNLRANPDCTITIEDRTADYTAAEVGDDGRGRAVVALILKYGTPAERLGHGPVFRLSPRR